MIRHTTVFSSLRLITCQFDRYGNATLAFQIAEEHLGIPVGRLYRITVALVLTAPMCSNYWKWQTYATLTLALTSAV